MTHEVETRLGRDYCPALMEIDDAFGIKASFQIIPEDRYLVGPEFLQNIRERGFEIAVHDLNHDGHLYRDRNQFLKRAAKINSYGKEFGAKLFHQPLEAASKDHHGEAWMHEFHCSPGLRYYSKGARSVSGVTGVSWSAAARKQCMDNYSESSRPLVEAEGRYEIAGR
jgi:hypothetical protein